MLGESELEARLVAWADEYGGGRYDNIGWSSRNLLQTLIVHGGFVPDAKGVARTPVVTAADEVEAAVKSMEQGGQFKQGRVVRCEYFMPTSALDVKLRAMRAIGLPMSAEEFEAYLIEAKARLRRDLRKRIAA